MDTWLDSIANDQGRGGAAEKVARNKPADLADACYTASGEKVTDWTTCEELYPVGLSPRLVAGEPLTMDRLKCALKPVDPSDYALPLTAAELAQIQAVFPEGVCDYSRKGMGQREPETWLAFPAEGRSVRLERGR